MNAVERIEKYLDKWSYRYTDKSEAIDTFGFGSDEQASLLAPDIRQLLQQRAELLEALKMIVQLNPALPMGVMKMLKKPSTKPQEHKC